MILIRVIFAATVLMFAPTLAAPVQTSRLQARGWNCCGSNGAHPPPPPQQYIPLNTFPQRPATAHITPSYTAYNGVPVNHLDVPTIVRLHENGGLLAAQSRQPARTPPTTGRHRDRWGGPKGPGS